MLTAVGILAETCNQGIEQNLLTFVKKTVDIKSLEEKTTNCVAEKEIEAVNKTEDNSYKWS